MQSPEDFIDKVVTNKEDLMFLNYHKIFTFRQLAQCDYSILEENNKIQLQQHYHKALLMLHSYVPKPSKKRAREVDVWGYCYIGEELYKTLQSGADYKSPYVLFEEYMKCESAEERATHMWKNIYLSHCKAAASHLRVDIPTDADVYSYLVWRDAQTLGKFDITAGPRAFPFVWDWMDGDLHGQCIMMDRILAVELNDPSISDRYSHQIAINLSQLCEDGGTVYRIETNTTEYRKWISFNLEENIKTNNHWSNFNPGEDYSEKVPHGCIVTVDGIIPNNCIHVFRTAEVTVRDVALPLPLSSSLFPLSSGLVKK